MNRKARLFRGLASVTAIIMAIVMGATTLTFENAGWINNTFNIVTANTSSKNVDGYTVYFENDYGYDNTALIEVYYDAYQHLLDTAAEGITLAKNENNALPLAQGSRITLFGNASVNSTIYKTNCPDYIPYVDYVSAMKAEFGEDNVNTTLCDYLYASLGSTGTSSVAEADIESVKGFESSWQDDYNDAAVVVFGRNSSEGNDLYMYSSSDTYEDGSPRRMLDLSTEEEALISYLSEQKKAGVFDKIIVIQGGESPLEYGFLEEYDIDACVIAGMTGSYGCESLAKILAGEINPSGHTVDTYAASSISSPAVCYDGVENTMMWTNADALNEFDKINNDSNIDYYVIYAEGIYVGYRYYETRYEDCVMNAGNANGTAGIFNGESAWNYEDEMCFTFGHGLSYTTFEQKLDSVEYDAASDSYKVTVTVTNTGDVAGKDVVEVYAQTPYGDYEKENLVEKSAISLVAYDKTNLLQPGESQTLTIDAWRYFMASYDTNGAGTYILSAGDYYISIGDDAHDALNNVLAAKGYSTADGMTADGDAAKTYKFTQDSLDAETYKNSVYTDYEISNAFEDADLNYYDGYEFTYLTRNDWEGTFPTERLELEASQQMMEALSNYDYETPADAPSVDSFTQGVDNGLKLTDMVGVDLDDEKWDTFVDQLTIQQMANLWTDTRSTQAVADLLIPGNQRGDDDTNANGGAMDWTSHPLSARTWNKELAEDRGMFEGLICTLNGKDEIWYGTSNLHRTPFGGRVNQYWAEDPVVDFYNGYQEAQGLQGVGCIMCAKHFAVNDQESQRTGLSTFVNEQTLREIYLKAFEGCFAGGALSTMATTGRVGTRLGKNYYSLLTTVLRDEWGFKGHVTSDGYVNTGYYNNTCEEQIAGMDYSCCDGSGSNAEKLMKAINGGDGYILQCLRESAKRNLYVMTKSASMNGLGEGTTIITTAPAWQIAVFWVNIAVAALFVAFVVLSVVNNGKKNDSIKVEG